MKCDEKRDNRNNPYGLQIKQWSELDATVSNRENFKIYFAGRNNDPCFGYVEWKITIRHLGK